jgi:hypothetical protein
VAPRLRSGGPSAEISFDDFCELFLRRYDKSDRSRETLRERLVHSRAAFGDFTLCELEGAADEIADRRAGAAETRATGSPRRSWRGRRSGSYRFMGASVKEIEDTYGH